jgi:putative peptide zinc metalloprotease protein
MIELPQKSLAAGTQLLGRYESPGMTDERYLVRRADGQVILLTLALYIIVRGLSQHRDLVRISDDVAFEFGGPVSAQTIATVIDTKIAPLGILSDQVLVAPTQAPLLSLTMKATFMRARTVRKVAEALEPLYWSPVVLVWLVGLALADVYVFAIHGVSSSLGLVARDPLMFLPVLGLVAASMAFHELGHATACSYGDGRPGRIGFGIYLIFPAFYTDVTDAYRLTRTARVRTDLGGVYFNAVSLVIYTIALAGTGNEVFVPAILLIHFTMVQQLLPVVRLDGYYILADMVGVPDLYGRIQPILKGLLPGRHDPRAKQLRPAARRIITVWVLLIVPLMVISLGLFLWELPGLVHDTYHSVLTQWDAADESVRRERWAALAVAVISLVLLCVPALGMTAFLIRITKRIPKRRTS